MGKALHLFRFLFLFILLCACMSCSVSTVSLDIMRPAEIDVPNHIQSILIINRSLPSKNNQAENILDGILSGEGVGDDKKGSEMCIQGLKNVLSVTLNNQLRFNIVDEDHLSLDIEFKGTGTDEFPKPIKWKKIDKLFKNQNIDGLIVLETFDSRSSIVNNGIVEKNIFFKKEKSKQQLIEAALNIEIQAGWRIYDIQNHKIIDKNIFLDQKIFSNRGVTFEHAKQKLPNKRSAISKTGVFAGEQYGFRISPKNDRVKRSFYIKAKKSFDIENEQFKTASQFIKDNNFEKSAQIWTTFVNHDDSQIASRACFNMAVVCELKNKYNLAMDWVKKSISYGNPKAKDYFAILGNRKAEIKKIKEQLKK